MGGRRDRDIMSIYLCTHTRSFSSLIALMLGRLGMSVEKTIRRYATFIGPIFSVVKQTGGDGRFEESTLEKLIKQIVKEQTGQENEHMMGMPPHVKGCKT